MQGTIIDGGLRVGRPKAQDIFAHMGPAVYRAAAEAGVNPSVYLETQDPSTEYRDGMDAFERLLAAGEVHTVSNPAAGIYASEMGVFDRSSQHRALVPELIARTGDNRCSGQETCCLGPGGRYPSGYFRRLEHARQKRSVDLHRVEHLFRPAPVSDIEHERAGRIRHIRRALARQTQARIIFGQQDRTHAPPNIRFVISDPQ
jgi:hypothetical protein